MQFPSRERSENGTDGLTRNVGLLCDLTSIAFDDCETVEAYVDKVISTTYQLKSTDFPIPDKLLTGLLLKSLPQTYKPMVMAPESSNLELSVIDHDGGIFAIGT